MHDDPICGAKTRDGDPCQNPPLAGRERCRMHGGASPAGMASPRFKTGKFSRYLPERLLERYEEAQQDEALLELRDEIALSDARVLDLLSRVDSGESGAIWRKLQKLWQDYQTADGDEATDILMEIGATINEGAADYQAWDEVNKQVARRQKLTESQRKREVELQQTITAEKAMVLIAQLTEIIRRHVTDRTILAAIAADVVQLTGHQSGGVIGSGGGA